MKTCTKCGQDKPLHEFHKDKSRRDGRQTQCNDCKAAYKREWHAKNRDEVNARHREWYEANRDKVAAYGLDYRAANRDKIAASAREYHAANRAAIRARMREYRAAHPEVAWANEYRRRARKFGHPEVVEDFTKADVIAKYGDGCAYCETGSFEELDHYVPVSSGGPHTLDNARPSCVACNRVKKDTPGDEWTAEQERLDNLTPDELNAEIDAEIARWSTP